MRLSALAFITIIGAATVAQAQTQQSVPANLPPEVAAELEPRFDGPRAIEDLSEAAQKVMRERLMASTNPVMPPVLTETKKALFDQITGVSPASLRDLFNLMTVKQKVDPDVSFDEVIEAMEIKANDVNFKKVGHNEFWKDVSAISGLPTPRVEVMQFCDAIVGRRMLDFSPEFSIFIPCRITVLEDSAGDIWVMMMDWDVHWVERALHPDSQLSEQLKQDAIRIRDAMAQIMEAGATGEFY